MEYKNVTTLQDLKKYEEDSVYELPGFDYNKPLIAKLRRPSILELVSKGKIPNELLGKAKTLFIGNSKEKNEKIDLTDFNDYKDVVEILNVVAEIALVSPTYEDIKNAGLTLTDKQLTAIFDYVQYGVRGLHKFRDNTKNNSNYKNGKNVPQNAK